MVDNLEGNPFEIAFDKRKLAELRKKRKQAAEQVAAETSSRRRSHT
ncbi:hypothetical protein AB0K88_32785 [Streptomyces werraensis]